MPVFDTADVLLNTCAAKDIQLISCGTLSFILSDISSHSELWKSIAGYLYSISASTLGKQWDEVSLFLSTRAHTHKCNNKYLRQTKDHVYVMMQMGPFLEKSVASFHLLPPTDDYVPPYKDPWRFWWQEFSFPTHNIPSPFPRIKGVNLFKFYVLASFFLLLALMVSCYSDWTPQPV